MLKSKELWQRLATEYRYAVIKIQDTPQYDKKLYYFTVFFGEAQRVLNREWDKNIALIYAVTHYTHTQLLGAMQSSAALPIDWTIIFDKLTENTSNLASYFEKSDDNMEELHQILGRFAEIGYAVNGNGSYLYEKGIIKFEPNEPLQLV